jgi:hypothetical protein
MIVRFLIALKYIRKDYELWCKYRAVVVSLIRQWPGFAEPPSAKMQAFAAYEPGWGYFLKRWLKGEALNDTERFSDIAVGLAVMLQAETLRELLRCAGAMEAADG